MDWIRVRRDGLVTAGGVVLPLGTAASLVPFRASFADAAASLVLVAVVTAIAIVGTRAAGYLAAVSSALWFDFFLTRPYDQLTITHRPDIEIAVSLLVVGVVVTELAARGRHHLTVATEESDYVGLLYESAEFASSGVGVDELIARVSDHLVELLHLRACQFEPGSRFERIRTLDHDGHVYVGNYVWPVDRWGLPGATLGLDVRAQGRIVGRFVLQPTTAEPVSLRRTMVAVALTDLVGSHLTPRLRNAG
jgi:Domain of unknown function (DUF4118)